MSTSHSEAGAVKKSVGGELVIPVASIIFTLYYFSTILDSPWTAQVSAVLIGTVLIALNLALIVKRGLQVSAGKADLKMTELVTKHDLYSGRAAVLAITIGYILLIETGGFTITTFFFLFLSMVVLNQGKNKMFSGLIAGGMALGGYGLFIVAFDTRFPRGPFEAFMAGILNSGS